jgi:hypothetical protein
LVLLAYTTALTEAQAHRKLKKWRRRGEWFEVVAAVLDEVAQWCWLNETLFEQLRVGANGTEA